MRHILARMNDAQLQRVVAQVGVEAVELGLGGYAWDGNGGEGRLAQIAPAGRWRTWLVMAGRGFGKTRAGAEWVRTVARTDGQARIAIVGATLDEARRVMVEGESGILAVCPPGARPVYSPSLRRLAWPNGATAILYGAAEPESLRGPQHSHAWADEIAKWPQGEAAWDNLMLALRMGKRPQAVATTTPRPVALVRRLVTDSANRRGICRSVSTSAGGVVVTRGRTADNAANLPGAFLDAMEESYGGTRLGRQELDGELIEDVAGALWRRALIEQCRVAPDGIGAGRIEVARVLIGVDPPAGVISGNGGGSGGDACGIVAVGLLRDGEAGRDRAVVLEDASVEGASPEGWARAVAACAARWSADRVIAEANNGGTMVESVLRAAEAALPVRLVHASRGKAARAEPVAALYEAGRVVHAGAFPALEDEMCGLIAGGGYEGPGRSPDRADALVWALTELMLGVRREVRVRVL